MAADGIFHSIFEGCISGLDSAIERRPYHKNCGCALHDKPSGVGKNQNQKRPPSCRRHGSSESISFSIRRSWSEGNIMALNMFPSSSSSSNLQSLSSSSSLSNLASDLPVDEAATEVPSRSNNQQLRWTIDEDD
ncbi:PREDICTED: uncharacterized protein LOC104783223 [Camelina sativa]|uniref:Uncharacterized protein LOC104783223 n=1 Tax=Camelina sativa TaxID=90675 RepID=A0ABM0YVX7_CAMSA|nr:PREDICTED: uncharacterized protein LOC104783223 [Camelina sativa]